MAVGRRILRTECVEDEEELLTEVETEAWAELGTGRGQGAEAEVEEAGARRGVGEVGEVPLRTIEVEAALDIVSSSEVCLGRPERQGDIME